MKRVAVAILLSFFCSVTFSQGYSELYEGEEAASLRSLSDTLSRLKNEEELYAFVSSRLEKSGLELFGSVDYTSFGIRTENGDTATFHNAVAGFAGYDRALREKHIVVGTRLLPGNETAIAALLTLAAKASTNKVLFPRSVIFAAFGAGRESNAGAWYFVNRAFYDSGSIDAYVNLDLFDNPNKGFFAYTASNAALNSLIVSQNRGLQPARPEISAAEPEGSSQRAFYVKEIPSVFFFTAPAGTISHAGIDSMEFEELGRQCEYIYNFLVALSSGPAPSFWPEKEKETPVVAFSECDTKPRFLGSSNPSAFLSKWVYVYLKYPQYAVENGIQGKVLVDFMVDEKGRVRDVTVRKGAHPSLDREAVRVIEASPDWKPGKVKGETVRTTLSLYVEFKLEKKK